MVTSMSPSLERSGACVQLDTVAPRRLRITINFHGLKRVKSLKKNLNAPPAHREAQRVFINRRPLGCRTNFDANHINQKTFTRVRDPSFPGVVYSKPKAFPPPRFCPKKGERQTTTQLNVAGSLLVVRVILAGSSHTSVGIYPGHTIQLTQNILGRGKRSYKISALHNI